jgi:hypothetical protein
VAVEPTLESVRGDIEQLKEVARRIYKEYPTPSDEDGTWGLDDYLAGIDALAAALDHAISLEPCTPERFTAEKYARNRLAVELYYRGRLCLATNRLGRFHKKVGEKKVHWAPTELSRLADRLAAEPLRHIYKATEACVKSH